MRTQRLAILIFLFACSGLLFYLQYHQVLTFANLKSSRHLMESYYHAYPVRTMVLYFLGYTLLTALSFPGAAIASLAGGALFGLATGCVLVSFATSIGSTFAFLSARYVLGDHIRQRYARQLRTIDEGMARDGIAYLFILRLIPLFPFFIVNLLMAVTQIRTWTFYWVSQLGMLACTVLFVNAGTQLAHLQSLGEIFSLRVIISLILLSILPLASQFGLRWLRRHARASNPLLEKTGI